MAWTQSDLDALETAMKGGVRKVKYSDKEVEYRDLEEMMKLRNIMKKSLGQTKGSRKYFTNFDKGLDSSD